MVARFNLITFEVSSYNCTLILGLQTAQSIEWKPKMQTVHHLVLKVSINPKTTDIKEIATFIKQLLLSKLHH